MRELAAAIAQLHSDTVVLTVKVLFDAAQDVYVDVERKLAAAMARD